MPSNGDRLGKMEFGSNYRSRLDRPSGKRSSDSSAMHNSQSDMTVEAIHTSGMVEFAFAPGDSQNFETDIELYNNNNNNHHNNNNNKQEVQSSSAKGVFPPPPAIPNNTLSAVGSPRISQNSRKSGGSSTYQPPAALGAAMEDRAPFGQNPPPSGENPQDINFVANPRTISNRSGLQSNKATNFMGNANGSKLVRKPLARQHSSGELRIQKLREGYSSGGRKPSFAQRSRIKKREELEEELSSGSLGFESDDESLPFENVMSSPDLQLSAKKKALVDSLVWFSFHTPRGVLEDLISHEMELWQADRKIDMNIPILEESMDESVLSESFAGSIANPSSSDDSESESDSSGSDVSDISVDEDEMFEGSFTESVIKMHRKRPREEAMIKLPKVVEREGALVFVDISGFTKLSTLLDCESLSKVINNYFDMIVSEVLSYGGDILKFAGDAFFAEWKVSDIENKDLGTLGEKANPLASLNASLSFGNGTGLDYSYFGKSGHDDEIPALSQCVLSASKCAASIVAKFSDFHVSSAMATSMPAGAEAILNVHCGIGAGAFVGLHVSDFKEDDEEGIEMRREFLVLGDPIQQAAVAADVATDGQVLASPETLKALGNACDNMPDEFRRTEEPMCIASRDETVFSLDGETERNDIGREITLTNEMSRYDAIRTHCVELPSSALARLHLQMAFYVHPVIREDELALSRKIGQSKLDNQQTSIEERHLAEAELRSVFTIFIKAVMSPKITGVQTEDQSLYDTLAKIMYVVSRELDRYSGHLRQFIVDDKGVVLIATFGLRGSTFPNLVANNGLPAIFAIHESLKMEVQIENRVGATFGKVYCGVVGGVRRHEFAVMGAPVNLAARLMASKMNTGILVDQAVRSQAGTKFEFNDLAPVKAKGYDKPVPVFEPIKIDSSSKKKKSSVPFVGRKQEKLELSEIASCIIEDEMVNRGSLVFLIGECGMGKSALGVSVILDIKKKWVKEGKKVVAARSTTTESDQRVPLSSFGKVFLSAIRDLCEFDGTVSFTDSNGLSNLDPLNKSVHTEISVSTHMSTNKQNSRPVLARRSTAESNFESLLGDDSFNDDSLTEVTSFGDDNSASLVGASTHSSLASTSLRGNGTTYGDSSKHLKRDDSGRAFRKPAPPSAMNGSFRRKGFGTTTNMSSTPSGSLGSSSQSMSLSRSQSSRPKNFRTALPLSSSKSSRRIPLGGGSQLRGSMHGTTAASLALKRRESKVQTSMNGSGTDRGKGDLSLSKSLHGGSPMNLGGRTSFVGRKASRMALLGQSFRRHKSKKQNFEDEDLDNQSVVSFSARPSVSVPYFEKLCEICEKLDFPHEYADIIGSQFLGLDKASPVTHVNGHIPTINELVEFLTKALNYVTEFADLTLIFVDDFQWVDSFTWKIFRELWEKGKRMMLVCAMRSHDKQAMRKVSNALKNASDASWRIEIQLGPLELDDVKEMTEKVLGVGAEAVDESLCSDIFERTGGLPVYVAELLEDIKRKKTVAIDEAGILRWTPEAEREQKGMANKSGAVMEESFLRRFDALDVRVRKVLQTCAVLGLSFTLSDVVRVHSELDELEIETALNKAVEEVILVERFDDEEETLSLHSGSTGCDSDSRSGILEINDSDDDESKEGDDEDDRFFEFSHAMWRQKVLATMLQGRKAELHRLIAEAMEKDQVLILEQSDISRLLTLFDHWKACGDFSKSAPLALAVGARLEEWDLAIQSLDLYRDALDMSFETVEAVGEDGREDEWVQVSAHPETLDLILRLHIRIGLCHQRLGDENDSIIMFEDAYKIVKTSSKIPGMSKALMMPIISTLCALKLELGIDDEQTREEQEQLLRIFVEEAREDGNPVNISRALAMAATYFAKQGQFQKALAISEQINKVYDVILHSGAMIQLYGYDHVSECLSESVQWYYLVGNHKKAEEQAEIIIHEHVPIQDPRDLDCMLRLILPLIQVLKLLDRARDADLIIKKYIINSFHDGAENSEFWVPLFNPIAYVLEVIKMEEEEDYDDELLQEMEDWVLDEDISDYHEELQLKARTWMGELCWRLSNLKDMQDPAHLELVMTGRQLLEPVAEETHYENFLRGLAEALLGELE